MPRMPRLRRVPLANLYGDITQSSSSELTSALSREAVEAYLLVRPIVVRAEGEADQSVGRKVGGRASGKGNRVRDAGGQPKEGPGASGHADDAGPDGLGNAAGKKVQDKPDERYRVVAGFPSFSLARARLEPKAKVSVLVVFSEEEPWQQLETLVAPVLEQTEEVELVQRWASAVEEGKGDGLLGRELTHSQNARILGVALSTYHKKRKG